MLPSSVRIFVCTTPQDMRRSFDGLALAARELVAARELAERTPVEHGAVAGLTAVRIGRCDLELLELLITETISSRDSMKGLGIELASEAITCA